MSEGEGHLWSMGAVTRATGLGEHTLRAWERRFGVPRPLRLESGHRRYTADQVRRLALVARALELGHRAGDVVPLPEEEVEALLAGAAAPAPASVPADWLEPLLEAVRGFDRRRVERALEEAEADVGLRRMLRERLAPLLERVGEMWAAGALQVAHEHFVSEVLMDLLRDRRHRLEATAEGPPVVLATLPGELHVLGLHLAAVTVALAGRRVQLLGASTPAEEIVAAVRSSSAAAVALSLTPGGAGADAVEAIAGLRRRLPRPVGVWVGGAGAALLEGLPQGVTCVLDLDGLERALAELDVVRE